MKNSDYKKEVANYIKKNDKINLDILWQVTELKNIWEWGNAFVYSWKIENKEIALKFLCSSDRNKEKRFFAEYINLQKLNHDNIVKYISLDKLNLWEMSVLVIVMKRYQTSLQERVKAIQVDSDSFKKFFNFLLNTVEYIHAKWIIHRDIKPENIFLDENDSYILWDFWIAWYNHEEYIKHHTEKSERVWNRLFSAPEQEMVWTQAKETMDIYAIWQLLYWFVTQERVSWTWLKSIEKTISDIPLWIDSVISRCTRIEESERFQSIWEIRDYIKSKQEKTVDPLKIIQLFDEICRYTFPKKDFNNVSYTNDIKKIDNFFEQIQQNIEWFNSYIRYLQCNTEFFTLGSGYFNPKRVTWMRKIWGKWFVCNIKEMWVYRSWDDLKNFALLHYLPWMPVTIDKEQHFMYYLVDNKHIVTFQEWDDWYAEINGKSYDLSECPWEFIELEEKEWYIFIWTFFNTVLDVNHEHALVSFVKNIMLSDKVINNKDVWNLGKSLRIDSVRYSKWWIMI